MADYAAIEEAITKVLENIHHNEKINVRQLANEHNLPYQRLLARYNGRGSRCEREASNKRFTKEQEAEIHEYMRGLGPMGPQARRGLLKDFANAILARVHEGPNPPLLVSSHWPRRFLESNPQYLGIDEQAVDEDESDERGPYKSLSQLSAALEDEITAGAESFVPECTTCTLSLDLSALLPLKRPTVGPYAEGGMYDLPYAFKTNWTVPPSGRKSHPQATVATITTQGDARVRQIVQRAASRGIVAAIESVDHFKYAFNNGWGSKDEDGRRYSYICQDSTQNKDRHANGYKRTQKTLKGREESIARKPTYSCRGSIGIKFSASRQCVDIQYVHYAIHGRASDCHGRPLWPEEIDPQDDSADNRDSGRIDDAMPFTQPTSVQTSLPVNRHQASNVTRPLKRKRDTDLPLPKNVGKDMSLVDILKQSQSARSNVAPSQTIPGTNASHRSVQVAYDLPSWAPQPTPPATHHSHTPSSICTCSTMCAQHGSHSNTQHSMRPEMAQPRNGQRVSGIRGPAPHEKSQSQAGRAMPGQALPPSQHPLQANFAPPGQPYPGNGLYTTLKSVPSNASGRNNNPFEPDNPFAMQVW